MNDKEICRRIIGNRRAMLARQLAENSALSNLAHSALFHNNNSMGRSALFNNSPLLSSILANALVQIMISKVDKGTQTLLRIPTKPDFYIRRGVLKHDVYTTRQRIETAIVPYRHGHSSRSSGRHKRHKRRRTSSHKRHTDESSRSRSRSRDSRKDRKRKRSKTSKDEAEILSDKRFPEAVLSLKETGGATFQSSQCRMTILVK